MEYAQGRIYVRVPCCRHPIASCLPISSPIQSSMPQFPRRHSSVVLWIDRSVILVFGIFLTVGSAIFVAKLFLVFRQPFVERFALCYGNAVLSVLFVTLAYCGQQVAWIRMPLRARVGLGPDDIVLDGDPAPLTEKGTAAPPIFGPCLLYGQPVVHLRHF